MFQRLLYLLVLVSINQVAVAQDMVSDSVTPSLSHLSLGVGYRMSGDDTSHTISEGSAEIPENAQALIFTLTNSGKKYHSFTLQLFAQSVFSLPEGALVTKWKNSVSNRKPRIITYNLAKKILLPGKYKVTVEPKEGVPLSFKFVVTSEYAFARRQLSTDPSGGINVALQALGGKLLTASSEFKGQAQWKAQNINDGYETLVKSGDINISEGWKSERNVNEQELVFEFYEGREALVSKLRLFTVDPEKRLSRKLTRVPLSIIERSSIPRHVKVYVSLNSDPETFREVAKAQLYPWRGIQTISFTPQKAARVKLLIEDNYGSSFTSLSEVEIIEEKSKRDSSVGDLAVNLLSPMAGGSIVYASSEYTLHGINQLVDGKVGKDLGWVSASPKSPGQLLPQSFIFAFKDFARAHVKGIEITSESNPRYSIGSAANTFWPQEIIVSASDNLADGFKEVTRLELAQTAESQHFSIEKQMRYLKMVVTENYGGKLVSIGEVAVYEDQNKPSVFDLTDESEPTAVSDNHNHDLDKVTVVEEEVDLQFETSVQAKLDSPADIDSYLFEVSGPEAETLTVMLRGAPLSRSSALLEKQDDSETIGRIDPQSLHDTQERSWKLLPGPYRLKVFNEPISTLLMWDVSGSMRGRTEVLSQAIRDYIQTSSADEYISLLKFSRKAELITESFSNNPSELLKASEGHFRPLNSTALFDAVLRGVEALRTRVGPKVMIVLTDGVDTTSKTTFPVIWHKLEQQPMFYYTIGLGKDLRSFQQQKVSRGNAFLRNSTELTRGRFFSVEEKDNLLNAYQTIAQDLRQPTSYILQAKLARRKGKIELRERGEKLLSVTAPPKVHILLDASGSMKEQEDGSTRMKIAKQSLAEIINTLPETIELGVRTFGHRIREGRRGDCKDSELILPFTRLNKTNATKVINSIKPLGTTALAYSIEQMTRDLSRKDENAMVIILTDGKEECGGQPLEALQKLKDKGIKVTVHVVGFALSDTEHRDTMRQLAEHGGGNYFDADNEVTLTSAIKQALAISYQVTLSGSNEIVAEGRIGDGPVELPEGVYSVSIENVDQDLSVDNISVIQDKTSTLYVEKEGDVVALSRAESKQLTTIAKKSNTVDLKPAKSMRNATTDKKKHVQVSKKSVEQLVAIIEKEIKLVPYTGTMKSSEATLFSGKGSNLDRTRALAYLLNKAGYKTRYARGVLDEKSLAKLQQQLTPQNIEVSKPIPALVDMIMGSAGEQFLYIGDFLHAQGFTPEEPNLNAAALAQRMKEYYWIQYQDNDKWKNADPLFGASELPQPSSTFDEIPPSLFHTASFTLIRKNENLLEYSGNVQDIFSKPIGLYHQEDGDTLIPTFLIGGKERQGGAFKSPFEDRKPKEKGFLPTTGALGSAIGRLGSLSGGRSKKKTSVSKKQSRIVAPLEREYLKIVFAGPGYSTEYQFPIVHGLKESELADKEALRGFHGMTITAGAPGKKLVSSLKKEIERQKPKLTSHEGLALYAHLVNLSYEMLRSQMPSSFISTKVKRLYTQPNIRTTSILSDHSAFKLRFDLTAKFYELISDYETNQATAHPFYDYLANGLVDHAVERAIFPTGEGGDTSAGELLDSVRVGEGTLQLINKAASTFPNYIPTYTPSKPKVTNNTQLVLMPEELPTRWQPQAISWWSIDSNGFTEDTNVWGYHSPSTDYSIQAAQKRREAEKWRKFGCTLMMLGGIAAGHVGNLAELSGDAAAGELGELLQQLAEEIAQKECEGVPTPVSVGRGRIPPRFGRPGRGFDPINRIGSRKPWIHGGRVFPAR